MDALFALGSREISLSLKNKWMHLSTNRLVFSYVLTSIVFGSVVF